MPGLVVVPGIVPQVLQQGDGPGGEQAVGADHHQHHRQEEIGQGGEGVRHCQSRGIAGPQGDGPQHHQQPLRPWLPLSGAGAVEQLHRPGPEQPEQVPRQRQQKEEAEESGGIGHAGEADLKAVLHRQVGQLQQQQQHQLAQQQPCRETPQNGRGGAVERLPHHHVGNVALLQPQDVVEPQLPPAALHDEAVGVQQQDHGEQRHHQPAQVHQALKISGPPDGGHDVAEGQVGEDVVHGGGQAAGEQIRPVEPAVAHQVHQGQPGEEAGLTHGPHRLPPKPSGCRRCGGTGPPGSPRPGRAGGTPARPGGTAPARRGWPPLPSG